MSGRIRRLGIVLGTAAATVAVLAPPSSAATPDAGPPPSSMASLGDSITRGFNVCGFFVDCTSRSWSTGDNAGINSHFLRIRNVNSAITGRNFNDARTGARVNALPGQAQTAVGQGVGYVTILMGANDACVDTEAQMTPVSTFRGHVDNALNILNAGLPNARIFIASIPDLRRLWQVERGNFAARSVWAAGGICQTMLANPTSDAPADVARRDRVRQRVIDFNTQLAQSCTAHAHCRFDGNAVFNFPFTGDQVSNWDFFHPNANGQAAIANVTYAAGFNW